MMLNEQRVREFAYQIWESEGRPFGQSERHWDMACRLVVSGKSSINESDVKQKKTSAKTPKTTVRTTRAKAASAKTDDDIGATEIPIESKAPTKPAKAKTKTVAEPKQAAVTAADELAPKPVKPRKPRATKSVAENA